MVEQSKGMRQPVTILIGQRQVVGNASHFVPTPMSSNVPAPQVVEEEPLDNCHPIQGLSNSPVFLYLLVPSPTERTGAKRGT